MIHGRGGVEGKKFHFQERWDLEKPGGDKRAGLQLHFGQKGSSFHPYALFLCSSVLHCLPLGVIY